MPHVAIEQVLLRASRAKSDSDFTYFFSLMLAAEALAKAITLTIVSCIGDDKDRHRYRLEHRLVRADGLGDWAAVMEDGLSGPASQFLLAGFSTARHELTKQCREGEWQYEATRELQDAATALGVRVDDMPAKTDLKRWMRLLSTVRNKTRGHGATQAGPAGLAAPHIEKSLALIYAGASIFGAPWSYLHRNVSGKYRVSPIAGDVGPFEYLRNSRDEMLTDGVYVFVDSPRLVRLMASDPELADFYFANGGFSSSRFELLSYYSDDKLDASNADYQTPPGALPASETQGLGVLEPRGTCFSNAPACAHDYVPRQSLEASLQALLLDDKRAIVTLLGRGGIGKTSLALRVLDSLYASGRYDVVVWLSARDVDLHASGPKPVRPAVMTPDDIGRVFAELVLSRDQTLAKGFSGRTFFEQQLVRSDHGPCLFVFDNFETTSNPVEVYNWIDTYIRLPNKALITTRLREFKGDYPLEVSGMGEAEARQLVYQAAGALGIRELLTEKYTADLVTTSEGHPYVIKVLLGEVAKAGRAGNVPRLVAGSDDILTALFERTYAALSPCAQRAFLTLAAWQSSVPRLALEAVLFRSTGERHEVERGIESLIQYSMAELEVSPSDAQEFIGLPLVASVFGKKKLNISPYKATIQSDVELLQMLGPSRRHEIHLGLARNLERFIGNVAERVTQGESFDAYEPVLEAMCRAYNPGWLLLARWHLEVRSPAGYRRAANALERFLENAPPDDQAAEAWKLLAHARYNLGDHLGEVHAFVERAQLSAVPFSDLSNTARRLSQFLREGAGVVDRDQKRDLAERTLAVLSARRDEASADDYSRMAWLALTCDREGLAQDFVRAGLALEGDNYHLAKLAEKLGIRPS